MRDVFARAGWLIPNEWGIHRRADFKPSPEPKDPVASDDIFLSALHNNARFVRTKDHELAEIKVMTGDLDFAESCLTSIYARARPGA